MKKHKLIHKKSGMLFMWAEDTNSYEPIGYDMRTNPDTGEVEFTEITKGSIFYDFIMYIRYSSMITDKKTGKKTLGNRIAHSHLTAKNSLETIKLQRS